MQVITGKDIVFRYEKKTILDHVSFSFQRGDMIGIIGPNGAGKTTLIKVISRILKPQTGNIRYMGKNLFDIPLETFARKIAFLPSYIDVYFGYTVYEFVSMARFPFTGRFGKFSRQDKYIIENTLELLEIGYLKKEKLWELSDGEKQRVFLAQVIAQEPSVLILDEPTAHLDIGHQFAIMDLLRKLNVEKTLTVISVLHDLNIASEYCNRLLLLYKGKIIVTGSPQQVLSYQNIEQAYNTKVVVSPNPYTHTPYVFGIPSQLLAKK